MSDSGDVGRLVIPGDSLGEIGERRAGHGVLRRNGELIATRLGHLREKDGELSVNPVHTSYTPRPGDLIVGYVEGMRSNIWFIDIGGPFNAILPMSLAAGKVDFGATREYMDVGSTVLCRVQEVDENHGAVVTMKGMGLRKLNSGFVDTVPSHLLSRVVGVDGQMLKSIKEASDCRMVVGQNGRIWIEGDASGTRLARSALSVIREAGHRPDIESRVRGILEE